MIGNRLVLLFRSFLQAAYEVIILKSYGGAVMALFCRTLVVPVSLNKRYSQCLLFVACRFPGGAQHLAEVRLPRAAVVLPRARPRLSGDRRPYRWRHNVKHVVSTRFNKIHF